MRLGLALLAMLALSACVAAVPRDGAVTEGAAAGAGAAETATAPGAQPVVVTDNPGISNTQNFTVLSETVSLEDDKARLEAQRKQFRVIPPSPLPPRQDPPEVNVVAYALRASNAVGEPIYRRVNPLGAALAKRACARYRLPDDAQEAFLKAGGPRRDPKNLDPDGDGFACDWNPEIYRKLARPAG